MQSLILTYKPEFLDGVVDLWKKCNLVVPQNDPIIDRAVIDFYKHLGFKEDKVTSLGLRLRTTKLNLSER